MSHRAWAYLGNRLRGNASERSAPAVVPTSKTDKAATPAHPTYAPVVLWAFIGGVIAAALGLVLFGVTWPAQPSLIAIGVLVCLTAMVERLQVNVYGGNTMSVAMAINFAAGLISGIPAVVCVSATIALVHYLQRRPRLYKTAFNWSTHVLAGAVPALILGALDAPLQVSYLPLLAVPLAVAALGYYAIESGLIAMAIGLSTGTSIVTTWRDQFQWLAPHYLVLSVMGLFLAIASTALGATGIAVFALPVLMMRFAQEQYVAHTENSVRELRHANKEIVEAHTAILQLNDELFLTLAEIFDARDPYVGGHAAKVADYAVAVAGELGLPAERVEQVRRAAFMHDIGKMAISEQILHKPGKLTDAEYELVKTHVTRGAEFLEMGRGLRHLAPFIRHHHERWDGRGYPDKLCGEEIPLESRILAVCDSVEAMASDRPYHRGMSLDEVIAEVRRCAGTQFDPAIADTFIRIAEREGERFIVNSARAVAEKQSDRAYDFQLTGAAIIAPT